MRVIVVLSMHFCIYGSSSVVAFPFYWYLWLWFCKVNALSEHPRCGLKWVENDDVLGSTSNKDKKKTLDDYLPYAVAGGRWQVKKLTALVKWGATVAELAI